MKHKRILVLLLSLILILSVFGSSCVKAPAPPTEAPTDEPKEESGAPDASVTPPDEGEQVKGDEDGEEERYFAVIHKKTYKHIPYKIGDKKVWRFETREEEIEPLPSMFWNEYLLWDGVYKEIVEPGGSILVYDDPIYRSAIDVSPKVYNYLEGWPSPGEKKQFLILMFTHLHVDLFPSLEAYYDHFFPGIKAIEDTPYGVWEGTAEEFKKIATAIQEDNDFYMFNTAVCFPEDIEYLFGVTIEQAQILVRKRHLDSVLCNNVKKSPLYGLSPAEIAAYIAAHPELLEENA